MSSSDPSSSDADNPYNAPVQSTQHPPAMDPNQGDATGGVIPYKNPKALIAYYVGILSLLIFPLGFVSITLGIMGLRDRKRNPVIKGSVHAWIGIVLGAASILCVGSLVVLGVIAAMNQR